MTSEIDSRMKQIREGRDRVRREQEQKDAPPPVVISQHQAMTLDESFRRDPERWKMGYVELTATKLHERALVAQNGGFTRWSDLPRRPVRDNPQA